MLMSYSVYVLHAIFIVTIQDDKYIYNLMHLQLINSFRFGGGLLDSCSIFHLRSSVDTQDRVQNNIYSTVYALFVGCFIYPNIFWLFFKQQNTSITLLIAQVWFQPELEHTADGMYIVETS